jgi:putative methyltransferase
MSKVRRFAPQRIDADLEWLVRNGVSVLVLADANFGMFAEDVELGRRVAQMFRDHGCPSSFSYNTAKNRPEPSVAISSALFDSGMPYKHTLSIQHTRDEVLAATERKNISSEKQVQVVRELMGRGIPVEVQLILGIPGDTYALWQGCFGDLMEWGIDGQYQTYLYHLLPNAPAASAEFRRRWQLGTVRRCVYLSPDMAFIASDAAKAEKNDIVVSSATYGREDWVRMNVYATFIKALHTAGPTQMVARYLRRTHGISYEAFYSTMIDEWAAQTSWYQRLAAHFAAFLTEETASEFLRVDELQSYPHPVAAFQWLFIQICLAAEPFFEGLKGYLLAKYPQARNLGSVLQYQKNLLVLPDYDSRTGRIFATDLDWPSYFVERAGDGPLADPVAGSGGQVHAADKECTNGVAVFPLDWFSESGDDRWVRWIDRVVLDYNCATRGTFQKLTFHSDALVQGAAGRVETW